MSRRSLLFWLVLVCIGAAVFSLVWGAPVSPLDLGSESPEKREVARAIFLSLRPTRVICALLVGASLSVAGAGLQTLFRNPLAEPYLLGISAGGALGATLASALKLPLLVGIYATIPLAWIGSVASGFLVFTIGQGNVSSFDSGSRRARLLLIGVALSAFLSALQSLVVALSGSLELTQETTFWLLGGLSRAGTAQNIILAVSLVFGFLLLRLNARDLDALAAGDEDALALGVDYSALQKRVLIAAGVLAASSVAIAGLIGFVGLLAPHLVRLAGGRDAKTLLPGAALGGAALLCGCDTLAHTAFAPIEVPVGIFTALLGVPLFLALARKM
ncbi:iron ABC transporter permease [bacterium]|nr:MAG: iron ABC transporter permease [bacterium]